MAERCPVCDDDGWIDVDDENGDPIGARDCPRLHEPGHAPFNATGLLGPLEDPPAGVSVEKGDE